MQIMRTQKRFCKDFQIKNLGEFHDLYVKSDTLLLMMHLKILEICVLIYMNLILKNLFQLLD